MTGSFLAVPGQGSQSLGMGRHLCDRFPAARAVFDEASESLGFELRDVMWGASAERLTATEHAQPAIVVLGVAALRAWQASSSGAVEPRWAVGHSVGAIAAMIAAGSLAFGDGVRLARTRGVVMSAAPGRGAMLAVAITSRQVRDGVTAAAVESGLDIACVNGSRQIVLAGPVDGVRAAHARFGARSRFLDVSHGFHSSLMDPVAARWGDEVAAVPFRDPRIPILSAISGRFLHTAAEIAEDARRGVRETVRWDLVTGVAEGSGCRPIVLGNGQALARMWRGGPLAGGATIVDDAYRGAAHAA